MKSSKLDVDNNHSEMNLDRQESQFSLVCFWNSDGKCCEAVAKTCKTISMFFGDVSVS